MRDPAIRLHVVSPPLVTVRQDRAEASSGFVLHRTLPSGETSFFMAGRYEDVLIRRADSWLYVEHKAVTHTRVLDMFTHLPI